MRCASAGRGLRWRRDLRSGTPVKKATDRRRTRQVGNIRTSSARFRRVDENFQSDPSKFACGTAVPGLLTVRYLRLGLGNERCPTCERGSLIAQKDQPVLLDRIASAAANENLPSQPNPSEVRLQGKCVGAFLVPLVNVAQAGQPVDFKYLW